MKRYIKLAVIMLAIGGILVGCGKVAEGIKDSEDIEAVDLSEDGKTIINLWSHFGGMEPIIEEFEKENPDIKINLKVFEYNKYELEYKKSLVKEKGDADLFIIDSNQYGEFNSINGLENLLKEDYNLKDYEKDFDKDLWELGKSMDKKEMLGVPIASAPKVTYYRKDIMEEYGFPSEPKELAEFMKDSDNWLKMAEKLGADGIYMLQWLSETIEISTADMPYFNENLEYMRDNERFRNAIDLAKEVRKKSLSPFTDIWSPEGKKLLEENKFAMLYLGSWGARDLEKLVPEQKGVWGVTSLPFGVNGWSNATIISMAENSTKKAEAWKFIEFYNFKYNDIGRLGCVSGYLPFRSNEEVLKIRNEFLNQEEQKFYEEIMSLTEEYPVTALDDEAFKLWDNIVNLGIADGKSTDEIMETIKSTVETKFSKEKEILLRKKN